MISRPEGRYRVLSDTDDRIGIFGTWVGPPVPRRGERIFLLPSAIAGNMDAALCILDDGLRCIRPSIEDTVPEYAETVDVDISVYQWRKIINDWEILLGNLLIIPHTA